MGFFGKNRKKIISKNHIAYIDPRDALRVTVKCSSCRRLIGYTDRNYTIADAIKHYKDRHPEITIK